MLTALGAAPKPTDLRPARFRCCAAVDFCLLDVGFGGDEVSNETRFVDFFSLLRRLGARVIHPESPPPPSVAFFAIELPIASEVASNEEELFFLLRAIGR